MEPDKLALQDGTIHMSAHFLSGQVLFLDLFPHTLAYLQSGLWKREAALSTIHLCKENKDETLYNYHLFRCDEYVLSILCNMIMYRYLLL